MTCHPERSEGSQRFKFLILITAFITLPVFVFGDSDRLPWTIDDSYNGSYQDTYNKLRWDVPNFLRQSTIDIAGRVGLDFQEGWSSPLIVRFVDSTPAGMENALAYVQFQISEDKFWQTLNINLSAYGQDPFNFQKVFEHELLHAMLNDAVGPDGVPNIPIWFHEGLAVYGAEQGDQMVRSYVAQYAQQPAEFFINGLESLHTGLDYAEDFLAFAYIHQEHGLTGLHNFIREVVSRKGDIPGALSYTCSEDWDTFQQKARTYALEKIKDIKREPRFRGPADKPY